VSGWLFVVIGFVIAALAAWQAYQLYRIRTQVDAVPQDGNVIALLGTVAARLDSLEVDFGELDERLRDVEVRLPNAITKVGVVSYDAFGNIAGQLSRSIALLDERGTGIVLTIMVSRDETMFFSKEISAGSPREPLSPEEGRAIESALAR